MGKMRSFLKIMVMLAAAGVTTPAAAQQAMYPGQDVKVNPAVGSQTLLYPGGTYMRTVPRLLEPGAPYPGLNDTIRLHMPKKHVRKKRPPVTDVALAPVTEQPTIAEAPPPPPPVRQLPPKKVATAQPQQQMPAAAEDDSTAAIPFSLSGTRAVSVQAKPTNQTSPPKQQQQQKPAQQQPVQQPQSQPPRQVALATPPPVKKTPVEKALVTEQPSDTNPNLSKHGQIKFRKNATDLVPAAMDGIRLLANDLTSALDAGAKRVQLEAYGGPKGDKSSESRRLSLKRALTIRQLLIDNGVPSSKIDVRAMGGASDGGAQDRVDVFVRA